MHSDVDLMGKTAIVTGASSGIGAAIAHRLGEHGAFVYLVGRTHAPMERSKAWIDDAGGKAEVVTIDVRDSDVLVAAVDRAAEDTGRLDVVVNNAGVAYRTPILGGDLDTWREMIDVNLVATLVGAKAAVHAIRRCGNGGDVINISSTDATRWESGVYGATKAAVNHITAALRAELEDDEIRVSTISPGPVATNVVRNFDPEFVQSLIAIAGVDGDVQPGGRLPQEVLDRAQAVMPELVASPDDIADAVLYILGRPRRLNVADLVVTPAKTHVL